MSWQPIETAPTETPVLVWAASEGWPGKFARICAYADTSTSVITWRVYGPIMGEPGVKGVKAQSYGEVNPTKWQPLPEAPE